MADLDTEEGCTMEDEHLSLLALAVYYVRADAVASYHLGGTEHCRMG
jgi:hypothetical protein